ncbi:MAG: hypothetical protein GF349_01660 [Candidatus Magasanikbacteria bacterium]|nr:hypothetical protein [Candidatus Magasanikbacteria bacterium]
MVDKITKALNKLNSKEKKSFKELLSQIQKGNFKNLDIKRLKNNKDIFRVRKGNKRIIFLKKEAKIKILAFEKRNDNTYKL